MERQVFFFFEGGGGFQGFSGGSGFRGKVLGFRVFRVLALRVLGL